MALIFCLFCPRALIICQNWPPGSVTSTQMERVSPAHPRDAFDQTSYPSRAGSVRLPTALRSAALMRRIWKLADRAGQFWQMIDAPRMYLCGITFRNAVLADFDEKLWYSEAEPPVFSTVCAEISLYYKSEQFHRPPFGLHLWSRAFAVNLRQEYTLLYKKTCVEWLLIKSLETIPSAFIKTHIISFMYTIYVNSLTKQKLRPILSRKSFGFTTKKFTLVADSLQVHFVNE